MFICTNCYDVECPASYSPRNNCKEVQAVTDKERRLELWSKLQATRESLEQLESEILSSQLFSFEELDEMGVWED